MEKAKKLLNKLTEVILQHKKIAAGISLFFFGIIIGYFGYQAAENFVRETVKQTLGNN